MSVFRREDPLRIGEIKLFKNMLLDERGNLVVVGTGSETFGSGRKGSFEKVYIIVCCELPLWGNGQNPEGMSYQKKRGRILPLSGVRPIAVLTGFNLVAP